MRRGWTRVAAWLCFGVLGGSAGAQVVISEFLAQNQLNRKDDDGDYEDWIELHNRGGGVVRLAGWSLTDDARNPREWEFPDVSMEPGSYLLVWASNKDRRVPGKALHTNFQLSAGGEYLALVRPDGTPATEFAPAYPPQVADVSHGFPVTSSSVTLLGGRSPARFLVPADSSQGAGWTAPGYEDDSWARVTNGIGYEVTTGGSGSLGSFIGTSVAGGMSGRNATGYLRVPWVVTNVADMERMELRLRYDDGFIAWLNGVPVLARNAPVESAGGVVGDQDDDWSAAGEQGVKGWYYGYYDWASDADRTYDPVGDFVNTGAGWQWNGAGWVLGPGNPPWTSIGRADWHPNGNAGGVNVQWAIRRWVSQTAGTVKVLLSGAKENLACGNGVTFRVLVNGQERFARTIASDDATGFATTLVLEDLGFGDFVDFALDPTGTDGGTQDSCDGATFAARMLQDPQVGPSWNSVALRSRGVEEATRQETFDLSRSRDLLVPGTNVLAVQVLNVSATDGDLLFQPEVVGWYRQVAGEGGLYFSPPTPGAANGAGVTTPGAVIEEVSHAPGMPGDDEDLVVTARVRRTRNPVSSVSLAYRVMYGAEVTTAMADDGKHDDGAANDGVWGARIPAALSTPGQMIRWAVSTRDSAGATRRWPEYPDPRRSPQYHGTVVEDSALRTNRIPVLHWFVQTPTAADTDAGTRGSLFFGGEFYDNVGMNAHGQSTRGFPKRSYDIDFNPGYKFRWREGQPRVDDLNLLTTWADKAHFRNVLAYETYAEAGAEAHFALVVRVEQNGKFFSVANLVENGDDNFLERLGLDPQGALYKMYNVADNASGGEKKTRKTEGNQDLTQLIQAVGTGTTASRLNAVFDRLDVPQVVNFLAARALTGDTDCCHKNYYLYRDSNRTGEWLAFPWDVDLSFGRVWTCGSPCFSYFDETIYTNTGLYVGNNNTVFSQVLNSPTTRQMYLRRFRTLADRLTQPPTVAPAEDRWLRRSTELRDLLAPDAGRDLAKWGTWGRRETITQAVERIHREFLPGRRQYVFTRGAGGALPAAQPADAEVRLAAWDPGSTVQPRDEYLMLTNANAYAVDISDWELGGAVRFRFRPGTVLPSRSAAWATRDRVAFRARTASPKGGEGRLVLGDYSGELSRRGGVVTLTDDRGRRVHALSLPASPSAAQQFLRVTEIHFHPEGESGAGVEFLELLNTGPAALDLSGVRFVEGVAFDFGTGTVRTLASGARVLVVSSVDAFRARYGGGPAVAGAWLGALDNAGERLRLVDAAGESILDFEYRAGWEPASDGLGFSLVALDPGADWTAWDDASQWRAGRVRGGTPGTDEPSAAPAIVPVRVNEILTHTDPPQLDAVEFFNPTGAPAEIGGWWLTDDRDTPGKYRIPAGTVVPAGGFLTLDERDFTAPNDAPGSFTFSSHGEEAWLFSADAAGVLTGYADGLRFGATANGVSLGRQTNSTGAVRWVPQAVPTFGAANAGPRVGPVVIQEIQARPEPGDAAFVELVNTGSSPVALFDPAAPTNTWRLAGVDFSFPVGAVLPPGGMALVVGGDPTTFRLRHAVPAGVPVWGPWSGSLARNGERLALERPDAPDLLPDGTLFIPWIVMDELEFATTAPWPDLAARPGASLERIDVTAWADEPRHWRAGTGAGTPGAGGSVNQAPVVGAGGNLRLEASEFPVLVELAGTVKDDGLPANPGVIQSLWTHVSGPAPVEFDVPEAVVTTARFPGPGQYRVRLAAEDGVLSSASDAVVEVVRPEGQPVFVATGASWKYWALGREPAPDWNRITYEDRSWPEGTAPLGYGDGDEATVLTSPVNGATLLTAYFRRSFVVPDAAAVKSLAVRLQRDDGAAVWLNGTNAFRSNLPEGTLGYATLATATVAGTDESAYVEQSLSPALLRSGTNVLAVEVHQQSAGSSDLSFDLELRGTWEPAGRGPRVDAGPDRSTTAGLWTRLAGVWSDDGLPSVATLGWSQASGPGLAAFMDSRLAGAWVRFSVPGAYVLRLAVTDGATTATDEVRVTVAEAAPEGYEDWRRRHFSATEMADARISGESADPDADGQSNLAEFRSGTHPREAGSALRLEVERGAGETLRLRFRAVAGRAYRLEWRSAEGMGPWLELRRVEAAATDQGIEVLEPRPDGERGGRLYRVVLPF